MNINKFTQKSLEAVNSCEKLAYQYGSPEIDQEHFYLCGQQSQSPCLHRTLATAAITVFFSLSSVQ